MSAHPLLWPYIAGAYGVTGLGVAALLLQAGRRMGLARRRLIALEAETPRRKATSIGAGRP